MSDSQPTTTDWQLDKEDNILLKHIKFLQKKGTLYTRNCLTPSFSWMEITILALSQGGFDGWSAVLTNAGCEEELKSLFTDSSTERSTSFADFANSANSCFFNLHI